MNRYFILIYGLLFVFGVFSYTFIDVNYIYLKPLFSGISFDYRALVSFLYFLLIGIFFIFYYLFIHLGKSEKILKQITTKRIIIASVILICSYPAMISYDIFNYIATAKVTFFYHENPYIIMPNEFINDPLLLFTHASNKIALYGPIWILLTGVPYVFSVFGYVISTLAFKTFVGIFYFLTVFILSKMTKDRYGILLFALNPLVLIETFLSGHNDIVMMFFVILSFYLLEQKKIVLACIVFMLSVGIKYATIILLPVFIYILIQKMRNKECNWNKMFLLSFFLTLTTFFLSSFREEIYPWYAIWFLIFLPFLYNRKFILSFSFLLSFVLMLRYIPFMLLGSHFGITPILKTGVTFIPLIILGLYFLIKKSWFIKNKRV